MMTSSINTYQESSLNGVCKQLFYIWSYKGDIQLKIQVKFCFAVLFLRSRSNRIIGKCIYHEIKKTLTPWKESYDQPRQHIEKQRHYLPTKVCLVKAMVFPGVMHGCESWTGKKAERRRIDAFQLWCWRRLLRVPWTARRSNQSILKEISPGCSLEGMMLKLKLQYSGHLM